MFIHLTLTDKELCCCVDDNLKPLTLLNFQTNKDFKEIFHVIQVSGTNIYTHTQHKMDTQCCRDITHQYYILIAFTIDQSQLLYNTIDLVKKREETASDRLTC